MTEFTTPEIEFGSQAGDVSVFSEIIAAVKAHNKQFSVGKLMAAVMIEQSEAAGRADELVEAGATEYDARQAADFASSDEVPFSEQESLARSIVGFESVSVLDATGLALSPLRQTAVMVSSSGEQFVGEMRLQVADGAKFSNFLRIVNPEDVDSTVRTSVLGLVRHLVSETSDAIVNETGGQSEQSALETLAYSRGIVSGLERIGLGESRVASKLYLLREHAEQGDIREYIKADRLELLLSPEEQGFGPAMWQKDASSDVLSSHWKAVLDVINAAKQNPSAQELFLQLLTSARSCLDYAMADWAELKAGAYAGEGYGQGFEQVFETVGLELSMIASPDEGA